MGWVPLKEEEERQEIALYAPGEDTVRKGSPVSDKGALTSLQLLEHGHPASSSVS